MKVYLMLVFILKSAHLLYILILFYFSNYSPVGYFDCKLTIRQQQSASTIIKYIVYRNDRSNFYIKTENLKK